MGRVGQWTKEIKDGTQAKLSTTGPGTGHLGTSPLVIALASISTWAPTIVAFDLAQATTYMQLAAWEIGIGSNVARIRDQDAAREALNAPDNVNLEWAISFGYPLPSDAEAPLKAGGRKPLEEIVRYDKWE